MCSRTESCSRVMWWCAFRLARRRTSTQALAQVLGLLAVVAAARGQQHARLDFDQRRRQGSVARRVRGKLCA
jgi:hypothetical protein